MKKLISILSVLMLMVVTLMGCTATDPITDDIYCEGDIYLWDGGAWVAVTPGAGTDEDAIHDDEVAEISAIVEKGVPVGTDMLVIEDSADGDAKKMIQIANLPAGGGNVTGPAGATDEAIARYDGAVGNLIQDSNVTIDNIGNITAAGDLDAFDINAGNDVNIVNDLDVTDNADIGGILVVVGDATAANIITAGNVDGRDVSVDGAKLDLIEALADVTDAANVNTAGATMNTDFNAKGDLLTATADDTPVILTVGADTFVLTADSGVANGIKWATPAGGGGVSYTELAGTVTTTAAGEGAGDGAWVDWDLSGTLPVGTETVEIHIEKLVATDSAGVRKDGSALAREQDILKAQVWTVMVEVESTRIIEIQSDDVSDADVFSLWGYWD